MSDVSNDKAFVGMREGNFFHGILTLARPLLGCHDVGGEAQVCVFL